MCTTPRGSQGTTHLKVHGHDASEQVCCCWCWRARNADDAVTLAHLDAVLHHSETVRTACMRGSVMSQGEKR